MPQMFGTITVTDGISMGTEGMKYSLVSREVIADSIETACGGQSMDGVVAIGGCDKNMPGAMIAIARMNIPAIFVYGGTIKPGHLHGRDLTIVSAFEAVGAVQRRQDRRERAARGRAACLPGRGLVRRHVHREHDVVGDRGDGDEPALLLDDGGRGRREGRERRTVGRGPGRGGPTRDLAARKSSRAEAFENAISVVMALGGSTNAVLHLLAIAHAAGVPLTHRRFRAIRARVPVLCDLKPSGRYVATDLHRAGGVPQVMKMLLANGLLHGDCLTITGQTIAETLARRSGSAARRSGRDSAVRQADVRAGTPGDPARQSRARRRGREDHGRQEPGDHRPGARVRLRGGVPRGDPRRARSSRAT